MSVHPKCTGPTSRPAIAPPRADCARKSRKGHSLHPCRSIPRDADRSRGWRAPRAIWNRKRFRVRLWRRARKALACWRVGLPTRSCCEPRRRLARPQTKPKFRKQRACGTTQLGEGSAFSCQQISSGAMPAESGPRLENAAVRETMFHSGHGDRVSRRCDKNSAGECRKQKADGRA